MSSSTRFFILLCGLGLWLLDSVDAVLQLAVFWPLMLLMIVPPSWLTTIRRTVRVYRHVYRNSGVMGMLSELCGCPGSERHWRSRRAYERHRAALRREPRVHGGRLRGYDEDYVEDDDYDDDDDVEYYSSDVSESPRHYRHHRHKTSRTYAASDGGGSRFTMPYHHRRRSSSRRR